MSILKTLRQSVDRIGVFGTLDLLMKKSVKRQRYAVMLREVRSNDLKASLRESPRDVAVAVAEEDRARILDCANAMLRDENYFFTFPYRTDIERCWTYDPLEKRHWPMRHYTESILHAADTPKDVKIVWEINRFKDLPTLAQAALLTGKKEYADEAARRMISWIEENPFAASINWASGLELGIRFLSWTATMVLLRDAGFDLSQDPRIQRSIYEQARYLTADLSTDKVVTTNHLIGEAAGLFVTCLLWSFTGSELYATVAREILEREILKQTFVDGATREATSWYHQFVTHFFDIVERVAARAGQPMSGVYAERLGRMKAYLAVMSTNGEVVRYGDADDGWAIWFEGSMEPWKDLAFGHEITSAEPTEGVFPIARQVAVHRSKSFLFLRAGAYGMGGAGFSSHAHDDFLSPILYLEGQRVIVDPGTFVYNGNSAGRSRYRGWEAHNGLNIGETNAAVQRMNFGWHRIRPDAKLLDVREAADSIMVTAQYGEWPEHRREITVGKRSAVVLDTFSQALNGTAHWQFHLDPQWRPSKEPGEAFEFTNSKGDKLHVITRGKFTSRRIESYDYSPSYRVAQPASVIVLAGRSEGEFAIEFELKTVAPIAPNEAI